MQWNSLIDGCLICETQNQLLVYDCPLQMIMSRIPWIVFYALLKHTSRKSSGSLFIKWSRKNVYPLETKVCNISFDLRWTRSPDCHFIPLSYWGWAFQWVQLIFGGAFLVLFLHWTSMQIHRFTFLSQAQSQMRDPHTMINSIMATFLFRTFMTHINRSSV